MRNATLTVSGTVVGLTGIPANVSKALISTESADIRYWVDGSDPDTTHGHLISAGSAFELETKGEVLNFRAIAVSGSATLQVSYA
jgi:hypothetical protein